MQLAPKKWVLSHLFLSLMLCLVFLMNQQIVQNDLTMTALDVGQGDAILIQTPEHKTVLIDAGLDTSATEELGVTMGFFDKSIDLFVITHPDRDHFAGAMDVLQKHEIGSVLLTGISNTDPLYQAFLDELKRRDITIQYPSADKDYQIGRSTYLDILYPFTDMSLVGMSVYNKNDTSIALRLIHQGRSVALLTGDAEEDQERELVFSGQDLSAKVFKLGHHGANTSSSPLLMQAVGASETFVSAGADNHYGHPHSEVLERVSHTQIRETAKEGSLEYRF